jgi:hypothetical protein
MKRPVRVLLPWFDGGDAVTAQLGFRLAQPEEDVTAQKAAYDAQVAARFARQPFAGGLCEVEDLPAAIAGRGQACLASIAKTVTESDMSRLRAGVVDLTKLVSFQKAVALDQIEQRVARASAADWTALAAICLPEPTEEPILQGTYDRDGKGLTITSVNPNLRVGPLQNFVMPGSGLRMIGFQLVFGSSHLHVVNYRDRSILKDGYHRCFGLLALGIHRVPCIVEEARSFADVHSRNPTLVSPDDVMGSHPPMVTDFHDPSVSMTVEQQSYRKTVRIHAEEFAINI